MKNKWRFFGLFVLYSFVLSLGWYAVYADYIHLPAKAADFVLSVLGYTGDVVQIATRDNSHYLRFPEHAPTKAYQALNMVFNIVPFIALCLATPKTTWFGRLEIIIYGCIALFILHVCSILAIFFRVATTHIWKDVVYYFFATLLEALAPIILWLAFMGKNFFFRQRA